MELHRVSARSVMSDNGRSDGTKIRLAGHVADGRLRSAHFALHDSRGRLPQMPP
jgi:hypothetical protein